jgi:hypothetical protein
VVLGEVLVLHLALLPEVQVLVEAMMKTMMMTTSDDRQDGRPQRVALPAAARQARRRMMGLRPIASL